MASIITLVTVMTINGQDFERQERVPNLEQCWRMAAERMEQMDAAHIDQNGNQTSIDKIGIGCVKNRGKDL